MVARTLSSLLRGGTALVLAGLLGPAGCGGSSQSCTLADCESEAIVTFPPGAVSGAFDLVIEGREASALLRCSDPSAPETADNPEGITCNAQGFDIQGHPLADEREVTVVIMPTDGSDALAGSVRLEAIDEITPNGPDCPPVCVVRNGQFQPAGGA